MPPSPFLHATPPPGATSSGPEAEERVVSAVVEAVLNHRLAPGMRLIERELQNVSGANRSAIRNGLLRLAQSGLVELSPNKGATIAMCSPEEARQIFEARLVIETATIRMLAAKVTDEDRRQLRALVAEENEAYHQHRMEDARHLARRFHLLLTELAGNDVLTGFLRDLINRQPLLSWTRREQKQRFCGTEAHVAIVEAVAAGNGEAAARLNAEHLRELEHELDEDRDAAFEGLDVSAELTVNNSRSAY